MIILLEREWDVNGKRKHRAFHRYLIRLSNVCNGVLVHLTKWLIFAHSSMIRRPVVWLKKRSQNTNEVSMESAKIGLSISISFVSLILEMNFWSNSQNSQFSLILAWFNGLSFDDETAPEREGGVNGKRKDRAFHPYLICLSNLCNDFSVGPTKLPMFAHSSSMRWAVVWWRNGPRGRDLVTCSCRTNDATIRIDSQLSIQLSIRIDSKRYSNEQ